MRQLKGLVFLLVVGGAGYLFIQNFQIDGLSNLRIRPREATADAEQGGGVGGIFRGIFGGNATTPASASGGVPATGSIRIATFNMQSLGDTKVQQPIVLEKLADVCRRFDVVAIQEVQSSSHDVMPRLVERLNAFGVQYEFVIGPRLGRGQDLEQYAYLFNTATVEIDRAQMYTLNDPDDLLAREPLVASFRSRAANPENAFTFTLINIRTEPTDLQREMSVLDDVVRLVQQHNPQEDDVLLLGDFNTDDRGYGELVSAARMSGVIRGLPTNTEGTQQLDNILYVPHATKEFTGRSGVFDFMREFNLSLQHALELSDHMPVWADFSTVEGGIPGQVATRPESP